ncbi:leucine-rich receptor-like protein kinase family protein isoform X2 [Tasmannia lanceolata]|uniref:leucine-rich receptor-like protein kinase family protein isoform X2 n=1 Tax=Tasmannia lanceolata TaxID=3420 RepID=UPI0040642CB1
MMRFRFPAVNGGEIEAEILLSFKASIHDPLSFLSSWKSSIDFCSWNGITCGNASRVVGIELVGKNLSGNISPSLFQLPFLESINLSCNAFSGKLLPETSSTFSTLNHLNLSNNNFSGPISIPRGFINGIETLDLSNNILSGEIPSGIGSFSGLKVLDLGGNVLRGKIPVSISDLLNLQFLTLASNELVGVIPPVLGRMTSLQWIYIGYNNLSGTIPSEVGNLKSLKHLDLVYNNLTGEIPSSLGNLTNLHYLFLYKNNLSGLIPPSLFDLTNLISLDLSDNSLSGEIPESIIQLKNLEILQLFSNNFAGKIPKSLASLPRLRVLQLWSNSFSGEIPKNLGYQNNLTAIDLSTNNLTGEIPSGLCKSTQLFKLILFSNSLHGKIPTTLSQCKSLQRIRLEDNLLSGELTSEFMKLPLVYYLDISGNKLSGRIDSLDWNMPSLQMLNLASNSFVGKLPENFGSDKLETLDLSRNSFSGLIPASFGDFSELMQLKLNENELSGAIPEQIASCKKLVNLDVSKNQLSGQIPASLSKLPVLGELDLSENQFSGKIPEDLGKLDSLVLINISHNHFHGDLPLKGAFLAVNSSEVIENDGLCGGGAASGLPACKTGRKTTHWFFISAFLAFLLFILSCLLLFLNRGKKEFKQKQMDSEEGIWDLQIFHHRVLNHITLESILMSVNEDNIISKGQNGVLYRGILSEIPFAVKQLMEIQSLPSDFWTEIVKFGKVRHPNVVKLLGSCRSENEGFLVYEFIEGRRLSDVLSGVFEKELGWKTRRRIAVGIARGLRFLHCSCSPAIFVGNLSPEKVILDGNDVAHPKLSLNVMASLCRTNTTKGFLSSRYVAPEIIERNEFTEKTDIYALGVILIELVTGKREVDPELGSHVSIVEWARFCYSECHLDTWIDPTMKGHVAEYPDEIVKTMNLAIQCTAVDPSTRPSTANVLKALESIRKPESWIFWLKSSVSI